MSSSAKEPEIVVVRSKSNGSQSFYHAQPAEERQPLEPSHERPPAASMNKIYRKLDLRIIPALWVLYFLSSFGNSAYGNALTMNYEKGHNLRTVIGATAKQLSLATCLDYVGFIVFDLPMNLIMSKVSPNTWLARIVITVGFTYICYAAVHTPEGLMVLRFFTGMVSAGVWPGMAYYISMYYPDERTARRIGYYFVAAQISAAVAGLVAAGFQKMDGVHGYYGWQWLMIIYGSITTFVGITLLWWLPGRPPALARQLKPRWTDKFSPNPSPPLNEEQLQLHEADMVERYNKKVDWNFHDLFRVLIDPRLWPLIMMYFGVVGVGIGIQNFATTIIKANNPALSGITLSLLTAPIWLCDALAIVLITPLSDKFRNHRGIVFSLSVIIIMVGLFVATFAPRHWSRYGGLLICGFGLGPTVPICMTWASHIMGFRHGDVGAAAATALVSGLGNLGSVLTTYALYAGYPGDAERMFRNSNMVMVAILGVSLIASLMCTLVRFWCGDFGEQKLTQVTFLSKIIGADKHSDNPSDNPSHKPLDS